MNCNIHPILYNFYLRIHDTVGAEMVHRRKRRSKTCTEIIFHCDKFLVKTGRLNTLPEAEKCGFWVVCRLKPNTFYHDHQVYELFLTPVHPKKRREMIKTITPLHQIADTAAMIA